MVGMALYGQALGLAEITAASFRTLIADITAMTDQSCALICTVIGLLVKHSHAPLYPARAWKL